MDVRKFSKRKVSPDPAEPCLSNAKIPNFDSSIVARDHDETSSNDLTALLKLNSADLGSYIESFSLISNEMRYDWFEQYEWLIYSEKLKGALYSCILKISIMNVKGISDAILQSCESYGLNMNQSVGLGFDGRATMPGCGNRVQRIIRNKYNKATYFHCGSHKFNLVVNDFEQCLRNTECNWNYKRGYNIF
ncbi:hypothetical protein ILUMI_11496 [Ignelater luminosus]|uniref:DUF4371 domain-containing protein n=1 Tax=Ignelater luminosus TaxID=2038154 RepID=A0A8K0D0D6_IGNLU|nr:hypothetical protein ILUMI_11496 [Ignelater luminosus]